MVIWNHIGGVMVSVLVSSVVDRWLEPRSGQTKDYNIVVDRGSDQVKLKTITLW